VAGELSDDLLLRLARLRDPLGVLSVYVDADPRVQATARPPWVVAVGNELRALRRRLRDAGPRKRRVAFEERLDAFADELFAVLDRAAPGRGRAFFAPLSSTDSYRLALALPLPTKVVLAEAAHITPLVLALTHGRPAGFVAVTRNDVTVGEAWLGEAELLRSLVFEAPTDAWREHKGPAAANPRLAQQTAPQHDRFERRLAARRRHFLVAAGDTVAALAGARSWWLVLVLGDARLRRPLVSSLAASGVDVLERDGAASSGGRELEDTVARELRVARVDASLQLVRRIRAQAHAGAAALGLGETLNALATGRAGHLLIDCERERRAVSDGVYLLPEGERPPGGWQAEPVPELHATERLIERALETGAEVTPLAGEAAALLEDADGVAALLRW
jgi:peptide subunit release factor 1 (eRF1)